MNNYRCLKKQVFTIDDYTLLPIRDADKYDIMNWRNAQMDVLRQEKKLTVQDQEQYFAQTVMPLFAQSAPKQLLFSFLHNNHIIGYGGLVYIHWTDRRAEVSFLLDNERVSDASQYRKEFTVFLELIKQLAFDELNFNRIYTETFDIRPSHIKVLEENGFVLEGRMKQHIFINGLFCDSLIHGFLKEYKHV